VPESCLATRSSVDNNRARRKSRADLLDLFTLKEKAQMPRFGSNLSLFGLLALACVVAPVTQAQITNVTNDQATPTPGAGHNYIGDLSEIVSPGNGSVSLRIAVPIPKGRGLTKATVSVHIQFKWSDRSEKLDVDAQSWVRARKPLASAEKVYLQLASLPMLALKASELCFHPVARISSSNNLFRRA
jgi:hypothetical protein